MLQVGDRLLPAVEETVKKIARGAAPRPEQSFIISIWMNGRPFWTSAFGKPSARPVCFLGQDSLHAVKVMEGI